MPRLRVSAISFLNTAPLMWDFDHGELRRDYRVDYTLPSSCAEILRNGMADIGIIPAAAYATIPDLLVIPDVAIAARGPVRSILLVSKVPIEKITSVAADTSSRSSVALLRVLFEKFIAIKPEFVPMLPQLDPMLNRCDAGLLIGDPALLAHTDGFHVYDLAEEWKRFTGTSFVFAFWAIRRQALEDHDGVKVVEAFQKSRDNGLQAENIAKIAKEWSVRLSLPVEMLSNYLTHNIYYKLDNDCLDGLNLFYKYASECGTLPKTPTLEFL
jgi:chorismate dehydratase